MVAFGTRPEAIKLATVLHRLGDAAHPVHSGQHFSPELATFLHRELELPEPHAQFATGGGSRGQQIGRGTALLDEHFAELDHPVVVVQGDTNTALAAAWPPTREASRWSTSRPGCAATTGRCPRSTTGC